mmetsp:Transcript_23465/g.39244  ORF Transcript_23465/g.39244 Transcript_23465/m.39244 type:complete len:94 (-) Transcript_23465:317-598(-)
MPASDRNPSFLYVIFVTLFIFVSILYTLPMVGITTRVLSLGAVDSFPKGGLLMAAPPAAYKIVASTVDIVTSFGHGISLNEKVGPNNHIPIED